MNQYNLKAKSKEKPCQWILGDMVTSNDGNQSFFISFENGQPISEWDIIEVQPNTICRNTGIEDCNGNFIYEYDNVIFTEIDPTTMEVHEDLFTIHFKPRKGFILYDPHTGYERSLQNINKWSLSITSNMFDFI